MDLVAEFVIEDLPLMINSIGRKHWSLKYKESVKWRRFINEQCNIANICGLNLEKAILTLTRHSSKEPDFDNLVTGWKVVIDALVKCGVLLDDKPSVIGESKFLWVYRPTKQGGRVTIRIEKP